MDVARLLLQLGYLCQIQGRFDEARQFLGQADAILDTLQSRGDFVQHTRSDILFRLAGIHEMNTEIAEARDLYQKCLSICESEGFKYDAEETRKRLAEIEANSRITNG